MQPALAISFIWVSISSSLGLVIRVPGNDAKRLVLSISCNHAQVDSYGAGSSEPPPLKAAHQSAQFAPMAPSCVSNIPCVLVSSLLPRMRYAPSSPRREAEGAAGCRSVIAAPHCIWIFKIIRRRAVQPFATLGDIPPYLVCLHVYLFIRAIVAQRPERMIFPLSPQLFYVN
jgi:hypothetical protein